MLGVYALPIMTAMPNNVLPTRDQGSIYPVEILIGPHPATSNANPTRLFSCNNQTSLIVIFSLFKDTFEAP